MGGKQDKENWASLELNQDLPNYVFRSKVQVEVK